MTRLTKKKLDELKVSWNRFQKNFLYLVEDCSEPVDRDQLFQNLKSDFVKMFTSYNTIISNPPLYVPHSSTNKKVFYYSKMSRDEITRLREQSSECEICCNTRRLCLDHCHETDIVRGVLCSMCNSWLGVIESYVKYSRNPNIKTKMKTVFREKQMKRLRRKLRRSGIPEERFYEYANIK